MKEWSDFLPYIKPHLINCPNRVIEEIVKRIVIDFCELTYAYQKDADPITLESGVNEYSLSYTPSNFTTLSIHEVRYGDDTFVTPMMEDELRQWKGDEWETYSGNTPQYYFLTYDNNLKIYPKPTSNTTESLYVIAIVAPTLDSTSIDDFFFDLYRPGIVEGVLYELKRMPKKDWTDLSMAGIHYDFYMSYVSKAKKRRAKSALLKPSSVKPVPFGGVN